MDIEGTVTMKKMRKRADRLPSLNVFSLMSNKTVNILVRITGTPLSKEEYVLDAKNETDKISK